MSTPTQFVLTWGIGKLLCLLIAQPFSVIIVDEAHERTVHTDILFGLVKASGYLSFHLSNQSLMLDML